jgi:hypothetical protein
LSVLVLYNFDIHEKHLTVISQDISLQNFRDKHSTSGPNDHNNSVDNSEETMSTNSANSPVPLSHQNSSSGGGGLNHSNHRDQNNVGAGADGSDSKRRHKSASEDGKVRMNE